MEGVWETSWEKRFGSEGPEPRGVERVGKRLRAVRVNCPRGRVKRDYGLNGGG